MLLSIIILFSSFCYLFVNITKSKLNPINDLSKIKNFNKVRYSKKWLNKDFDAIIIGSGIGGLSTGGFLAKAGKRVLVLEQHYEAGGTMHTFDMKGIEHETGIHYIGEIEKNRAFINSICSFAIQWEKMGWEGENNIYDEIIIGNKHYEFPSGKQNLINYLIKLFPNEKKGIIKYFEMVNEAVKQNLHFVFKVFNNNFIRNLAKYIQPKYYEYCTITLKSVLDNLFKDEELKAVLAGQFGDHGLIPEEANFFIHACVVNHYLEGGYYPRKGPSIISESICKFIFEHGGAVLVGKEVEEILIENNKAYGIKMKNGDEIISNNIISGAGVRTTFTKLVNQPTSYDNLINKIDRSATYLYCFINLQGSPDELDLKSRNYWIYPHNNYKKAMDDILNNPFEAEQPCFIGFSCKKDRDWMHKDQSNAIILGAVKKELFNDWENEKCTNRSDKYKELKNKLGKRLIDESLLRYFPQLKNKISYFEVGTPLTNNFYFNYVNGESYGLKMDTYRSIENDLLRPKTEIENLYLTGQDICTMGFTGALLGSVICSNVVVNSTSPLNIIKGKLIIPPL